MSVGVTTPRISRSPLRLSLEVTVRAGLFFRLWIIPHGSVKSAYYVVLFKSIQRETFPSLPLFSLVSRCSRTEMKNVAARVRLVS